MKIALVGTADSYSEAPFKDEDWQVWALVGVYHKLTEEERAGVDKWYELHTFEHLTRECDARPEFFDLIRKLGSKVVLYQKEQHAEEAMTLKKEELINTFGSYFTSSIAWMLGEAILEKPEQLGIWGIHCGGTNEYTDQRPCIEGYLRFLQGQGVPTYIHPNSSLFKAPLYCTGEWTRLKKKISDAENRHLKARDDGKYWIGYKDALSNYKNGIGD